MSRPEILFPLFADLVALDGIGPKTAKLFEKLDIERPAHLLMTLPVSGTDRRLRPSIQGAVLPGVTALLDGEMSML